MAMLDVKGMLQRYGLRPSKGLGQHFLIDGRAYERILDASELSAQDTVLEIGPGLGTLTRRLAERVGRVLAVELDRKMVQVLTDQLGDCTNVRVVQGDILDIDPGDALAEVAGPQHSAAPESYKVVANLPYYVTSAALKHLLTARVRPTRLTLMVQREVAQRIVARAGDMSLLAVSVQVFGEPRIVCRVSASAFYPRPKVDSAVLTIRVYGSPRVPRDGEAFFFRVVQAGFGQKRKQIHNSLSAGLHQPHDDILAALQRAGVAADRRPQTLGVDEWLNLAEALRSGDS